MTLDLERQAMAATEINDTGILTRTDKDARSFRGKATKERPGIAVAAMLRPHHTEHAQFSTVGIASQASLNFGVILLREPFLTEGGGDERGSRPSFRRPRPQVRTPLLVRPRRRT